MKHSAFKYEITDKATYLKCLPFIKVLLRNLLYSTGLSDGSLVTTPENQEASGWWEMVLWGATDSAAQDVFTSSGNQFDGKGFEMLAALEHHFNPSGRVNAIAKLIALCDLKQEDKEELVTLKKRLTTLSTALNSADMSLHETLQVGFMLRALSPQYQAVVAAYQVGNRDVTSATLQTVVDSCTDYDESFTLVWARRMALPSLVRHALRLQVRQTMLVRLKQLRFGRLVPQRVLTILSSTGETPSALHQSAVLFVMILHARRTMMQRVVISLRF